MQNPQRLKTIVLAAFAGCLTGLLSFFWPGRSQLAAGAAAKWVAMALALFMAAVPLLLLAGFAPGESIVTELLRGRSLRFVALAVVFHLLPVFVLALGGASAAVLRTRAWTPGLRSALGRVHLVIITISALALTLVLWHLNVLGHVI
jgi:hypothetical protein